MANIDLRMAVVLDTIKLEEVRRMMEQSDAQLIQKMEKVSKSMFKMMEKSYTGLLKKSII